MTLVVFDLGGTSVKHGIWHQHTLSETGAFSTPETYEGLVSAIQNILDDSIKTNRIDGLAFSMPGAVNVEASRVDGISAIPYIHGFDIFKDLSNRFSLPISIENDANCAGICELGLGAAKDARNVVFLVLGTGVGGAVFINRELYKGSHLFAGEFGIMRVTGQDTLSREGSAIALGNKHSEKLTAKEVFARYDSGEAEALKVVDEWLDVLATGLCNIQMALDPELVVLGGGVSKRRDLSELLSQRMLAKLEREGVSEIMPTITSCNYFNNANLIGAALNFESTFK